MKWIEKRCILEHLRKQYQRGSKGEKGKILDTVSESFGTCRRQARRLMTPMPIGRPTKPGKRGRPGRYRDIEFKAELRRVWRIMRHMCSRHLKAGIPDWLPAIEEARAIRPDIRERLLSISAPTIDRILKPYKAVKGLTSTRSGGFREEIPIQENIWDISVPGYIEADTVAHCGGSLQGEFINSFVSVDIATIWTEARAVFGKASGPIVSAIEDIEFNLPFSLLGYDSDTGQGGALVPNANKLGISISDASFIVLSHGHFDHSGGLADALTIAPAAQLILHPQGLLPRFSLHLGKVPYAVGMPEDASTAINNLPSKRLIWSESPVQLTPNVGVTGKIPRESAFEDVGGPYFLDLDGTNPDPLLDDQALWINTPEGVVICLGCGHSGLVNTINHVKKLAGATHIHAIIGGFHLVHANEERIQQTLDVLKGLSIDQIVPLHCTGKMATERIKSVSDTKVINNTSERVYTWPG